MDVTEERLVLLVRFATIVEEHTLWPRSLVADARERLTNMCGHVPSLEQLAARASAEQVYAIAARVIEDHDRIQRETAEELGENSPCHLCGGFRDHNDLDCLFGLARVVSRKLDVAGSVASLAMNVLTLPFGVFVGSLPGSSTEAYVKELRLVMCATCGNRRKGSFWNNHELKVSRQDCAKHPSWARLAAGGFTTFLDPRQLQQFH
jgi:hypothetical protein